MITLEQRGNDLERDELISQLARLDEALELGESSGAADSTLEELRAELETLLSDVRQPPPVDQFENESGCRRAIELVQAIGQDPPVPAGRPSVSTSDEGEPLGSLREYQLLSKLGQGGMGTVYKALHTKLDKVVALKVLPAERLQGEHGVARFQREMQAVGKLGHPNIVRATDAGEHEGTHFLVMEYVDGIDLSRLVHSVGPLPVADACQLIRQAALGLGYAHRKGIVHRDIKPSNLILARTEDGPPQVKILDMGLALFGDQHATDRRELTTAGQVMGTLDYMAPEQGMASHEVDIRADIYSLGATFYRLLCGQTPFSGEKYNTPIKRMMALATETPLPIGQLRSDVPDDLASVVDVMLARDPNERYPTPDDVAAALAPFCEGCDLDALLQKAERQQHVVRQDRPLFGIPDHLSSSSCERKETGKRVSKVRPEPPAAAASPLSSAWRGRFVLLGVVFGFLAVCAAAWVVRVATDQGDIMVTAYDPDIEIAIRRNKQVVDEFQVKQRSESVSYFSGDFEIEIKGGTPEGVVIENQAFRLKRRGHVLVEIVRAGGDLVVPGVIPPMPGAIPPTGEAPPLAKAPFDAEQARAHQQAWTKHLGTEVEMTNSIGMRFRLIPPGAFMMGSPQEEIEQLLKSEADDERWLERIRSEGTQHRVRLTRPFYLGVFEVTQEEYLRVMPNNPSHFSSGGGGKEQVMGNFTNRHPVEMVSLAGRGCFLQYAKRTGKAPALLHDRREQRDGGHGQRLPAADRSRVGIRLPGWERAEVLFRRQ